MNQTLFESVTFRIPCERSSTDPKPQINNFIFQKIHQEFVVEPN